MPFGFQVSEAVKLFERNQFLTHQLHVMKQLFTFLASLAFSTQVFSGNGLSQLSVTSTGNSSIRLMVDGVKYRTVNNAVLVSNLAPGYHNIKIFRNGNVYNYPTSSFSLVYNNSLFVKPQNFIEILISKYGKVFVDEEALINDYDDNDQWGDEHTVSTPSSDWNTNSNGHFSNAMNNSQFDVLKQTLSRESFESTRLNIAKSVICDHVSTTTQVRSLMDMFDFESNKIDLAKAAFKNTCDKNNYFTLCDAFSFSSYKDELLKFIRENKS